MSKPWKGWMPKGSAVPGVRNFEYVAASPDRLRSATSGFATEPYPVIVQPIEDESLPHPGDGRNWLDASHSSAPEVEVLAVDGEWAWVKAAKAPTIHYTVHSSNLRERKPEPEHEEWCDLVVKYPMSDYCSCERRSGEDRRTDWPPRRREGRRATDAHPPMTDRRDGTDRRQS